MVDPDDVRQVVLQSLSDIGADIDDDDDTYDGASRFGISFICDGQHMVISRDRGELTLMTLLDDQNDGREKRFYDLGIYPSELTEATLREVVAVWIKSKARFERFLKERRARAIDS